MIPFTSTDAAPSFDHPLEMLHACHGKILQQCDTLKKLTPHLQLNGCDRQAQQAAQNILRYFDTAGMLHHQDEEADLFPALRASDQEQVPALLARLLSEHIVMLSAWQALRTALLQIAQGITVSLPPSLTENFIRSHTAHITLEEAELLPLAARLLSLQQLAQIGRNMAARRTRAIGAKE